MTRREWGQWLGWVLAVGWVLMGSGDKVRSQSSCTTEACQVCRSQGYTADDTCSFLGHRTRVWARERYCYKGEREGHDNAANLLRGCACHQPTVCNLSWGICSARDWGCPYIDCNWPNFCEGGSAAFIACRLGEWCVGEWADDRWGPIRPLEERTFALADPLWHATDCDCWRCNYGFRPYFRVYALNGDFDGDAQMLPISQRVADAGELVHWGWQATQWVERGYRCGYEKWSGGDWRCVQTAWVVTQTKSRSWYLGEPDRTQGPCL